MDENYNTQEITESEPDKKEFSSKQKFWISFCMGMLCAVLVLTAAAFAFLKSGSGRLLTGADWEYYKKLDKEYGKYYEILELIDTDPLVEGTKEDLTEDDIKALVASFGDPYAQYFTAKEYEEFFNSFAGEYVGIGIGIVKEDDKIVIKSVFSNGPAAEAGIQMEDQIVDVDGKVPGSVEEAVALITGEAGTSVTVTVARGGEEFEYTMVRESLNQESVAYYEMEDAEGVGYINLLSFVKETDEDFKLAVRDLSNKGCDKFIIDLRNNGGGLTDSSIEIADYLLPSCTIMTDVLKDGTETVYSSEASSADIDYVVLVNGNTASASEILTAAIQDNNGGKVIGSKTYGKGVTQAVHRFEDGSALKYTVSEYYRPNGDTVQGIGITPDIISEDADCIKAALEELNN